MTNPVRTESPWRPTVWLSVLGVSLLLFAGCSSTLEEYRCTVNDQCIDDEGQGICHSSGYCAFVDFEECDGYRFGKQSGENSGLCVDDEVDAGVPDAAQVDDAAPPTPPTASIAPITVDCEQTQITPDGQGSEAYDGATLTLFAWTIRSPSGAVISSLVGAPGSAFDPNSRFFGGTVANPSANLTPYMDDRALKVDTDSDDTDISQIGLTIPAGPHRLTFAAAKPAGTGGSPLFFDVGRVPGSPLETGLAVLTEQMTTYSLDFDNPAATTTGAILFQRSGGEYWIDNVMIQKAALDGSNDANPIGNGSFESFSLNPWQTDLDGLNASAGRAFLLSALAQFGDYEVELVVRDSNDLLSQPVVVTVSHAACP